MIEWFLLLLELSACGSSDYDEHIHYVQHKKYKTQNQTDFAEFLGVVASLYSFFVQTLCVESVYFRCLNDTYDSQWEAAEDCY